MLAGCTPWPEDLAAGYRAGGLWLPVPLGELARDVAAADPGRVAVVAGTSRVSYAELDARADRIAGGLLAKGLRPGDRVVLQLPNEVEFVEVLLGCFRSGVVPALALGAHGPGDVAALIHDTGARGYVASDRLAWTDTASHVTDVVRASPGLEFVVTGVTLPADGPCTTPLAELAVTPAELPEVDPAEVAFFFLTGGTTGRPKLIPRTHEDYFHQMTATAREVGFDASGVYAAVLPAAHNAALGCPGVLGALAVGAKAVLCRTPSPDEVFDVFAAEGVTLTTVMPSVLKLWVDLAEYFDPRLSNVHIEVGGARCEPDLIRAVRPTLGASVSHWFGMAEGLLCFTRPDDDVELAATTQGLPLNDLDEVRVVDEAGTDVAPGGTGELLCRGPSVLRGYYGVPEYNKTHFTADGFLRTGDLVRRDPAGRIVVVGRIKDVVNRGGEKIGAEEIESHLAAFAEVASVAVVALPDSELGERVCAVVVPRAAVPSLGALRDRLRSLGLAEFKLPERMAVVDRLPLTSVGKVDKAQLVRDMTEKVVEVVAVAPDRRGAVAG